MSTSHVDQRAALAESVVVTDTTLTVALTDGRAISVPIDWYPRLAHGSMRERANWRLIGTGEGIHWPELDEDISIDGLLAGARSSETSRSIENWLRSRRS